MTMDGREWQNAREAENVYGDRSDDVLGYSTICTEAACNSADK